MDKEAQLIAENLKMPISNEKNHPEQLYRYVLSHYEIPPPRKDLLPQHLYHLHVRQYYCQESTGPTNPIQYTSSALSENPPIFMPQGDRQFQSHPKPTTPLLIEQDSPINFIDLQVSNIHQHPYNCVGCLVTYFEGQATIQTTATLLSDKLILATCSGLIHPKLLRANGRKKVAFNKILKIFFVTLSKKAYEVQIPDQQQNQRLAKSIRARKRLYRFSRPEFIFKEGAPMPHQLVEQHQKNEVIILKLKKPIPIKCCMKIKPFEYGRDEELSILTLQRSVPIQNGQMIVFSFVQKQIKGVEYQDNVLQYRNSFKDGSSGAPIVVKLVRHDQTIWLIIGVHSGAVVQGEGHTFDIQEVELLQRLAQEIVISEPIKLRDACKKDVNESKRTLQIQSLEGFPHKQACLVRQKMQHYHIQYNFPSVINPLSSSKHTLKSETLMCSPASQKLQLMPLLKHPSQQIRLLSIQFSQIISHKLSKSQQQILLSQIVTLRQDSSLNVRIKAVEMLSKLNQVQFQHYHRESFDLEKRAKRKLLEG